MIETAEVRTPLLAFLRDLTRYARDADDAGARRAVCSPFSGVDDIAARALCVGARAPRTLRETIDRDRTQTGFAFARALDAIARAYRAQGTSAREHVETIALAFEFETRLTNEEFPTLAAVRSLAARLDAERTAGADGWDAAAFECGLTALAAQRPAGPAPAEKHALRRYDVEAPRNVKRRRGHFSASSLGSYAECERKWFYRYVCGAVEDRGSAASFYGTAFHWALERFHEEYPRADAPAEELERKLDAHLGTAFERYRAGFETQVAYELNYRRAKRTARRYLAWFLERSRKQPFHVIGTETAVELDLGGYGFVGYIDRLDADDATGNVCVIDYKTGSIPQSAREYRAKVAKFLDFQLPFYYWARTAAGDRVTRLALVPLKDATLPVRPVELEVVPVASPPDYSDAASGTIGIDELERARAKMIELAATLSDAPIDGFATAADVSACTFCAYQASCRKRPPTCESRFGR